MILNFGVVKVCNQFDSFTMTAINAQQERNKLMVGEESQEYQEKSWIEVNFLKRECIKFLPFTSLTNESLSKCRCGRLFSDHHFLNAYEDDDELPLGSCFKTFSKKVSYQSETKKLAETSFANSYGDGATPSIPKFTDKWNTNQHTGLFPTDAHGTLEFQGTGEGDKSKYIRLSHDTDSDLVLRLLHVEWKLREPKMVITVHGGTHNFQLQPKLYRVFCNGLIKAAKTTGAWLMTCGLNSGVGQIVGNALKEHKMRSRGKIVSIGVAPWGVVDHREDLIGSEQISSYQTMENPQSKGSVLHTAHTHFLLVDNGTEGRYDTELRFRRQLERKLSLQSFHPRHGRTSMVCLVLEGGKNTINVVLESVRQTPPIPVVVCDGSGRAADLIAFAHQYVDNDGTMMEELKVQLLALIQDTFKCNRDQAQYFYLLIMDCVKKKDLITIFRMGQNSSQDDIDIAILTAILKAQSTSAPDMLNLALSWNRIDIAKSQIFVYGRKWPVLSLDQAMLDALISDRVDFVKLLMENGVSMHKFLTVSRLEEIYNAKPPLHLVYLISDVRKNILPGYRFNLIDIGLVIELLMGGAYRSNYTRKKFRLYYASKDRSESSVKRQFKLKKGLNNFATSSGFPKSESFHITPLTGKREPDPPQLTAPHFLYPFHDLMIWAVLMKRQKMALFMWQQGEEAIAKALVASKLYKMMAKEAMDDDLDVEDSDQLRSYSKEFQDLAIRLLEICFHADDDATMHLLTYELKQWSRQTCLSLAVSGKLRDFIAHRCVQLLINDLWMGGLNERKNSGLKVIMGILLPPTILKLDFKTKAELQLMPRTMAEHMHEVSSLSSVASSSSDSSSSDSSSSSSSSNKSLTSQPKPEVLGRPTPYSTYANDVYTIIMSRPIQITLSEKIYEFYNAPITKFWMYAMAFVAVLLLFTCVCLVRLDELPSVFEWIVISHATTFAVEKLREIIVSEPSGAVQKVKVWISQFWNFVDSVTIILFFFGVGFRLSQDSYFQEIGRVFYCVDIVFWYIHLLNIFSVNKYLGPYIMLMGKMMVDMFTFIILLFTVLCSFGVARQSLLHPNRNATLSIVKDVFLEPYFMLYGEVYAGTIDPCSPENKDKLCVTGSWIVPVLMTIYLLVANILLINLLIAVFNNTFARGKNYSDRIWRFQRYLTVVEYELRPVFPPPVILVSYLVMLLKTIFKKRKAPSDRGLKLFLDDDDVEKLHDFEEDCVDEYLRCKDKEEKAKMNDRLQDKLERLIDNLDEIRQRDSTLTNHILDVHERLSNLEDIQAKLVDIYHSKCTPRSRRNTGGLCDPWSVPEDQVLYPLQTDLSPSMPSRALLALRHRRRKRQDSELSTMSDWHQHNFRVRNLSQEPVKLAPVRDDPVKRSSSTGVLAEQMQGSSEKGYRSQHSRNSLLSVEQNESRAQSCQDIMLVGTDKRNNPDKENTDSSAKLLSTDQLQSSSPSPELRIGDSDQTDKSSPPIFIGTLDSDRKLDKEKTPNVFNFTEIPPQTLPDVRNSWSNLQRASLPLAEAAMPRNKSFSERLSGGRKFAVTTPNISIPASPATKPTYQSITDQIDTTRWHEVYDPKVPSTPFDTWWIGKAPDFDSHRPIKFGDHNSLTEGEDEGDVIPKKKGRSKHRKRPKRNKKHLSEVPEVSSSLQLNSTNDESFVVQTSTILRPRKSAGESLNLEKCNSETIRSSSVRF